MFNRHYVLVVLCVFISLEGKSHIILQDSDTGLKKVYCRGHHLLLNGGDFFKLIGFTNTGGSVLKFLKKFQVEYLIVFFVSEISKTQI